MSDSASLSYAQPSTPRAGLYYQHSGQVTPTGMIVGGIVGVLAAVVMAVVYAWAVQNLPYIKLRALATVCFGLALGAIPAWVMYKLKVRNLPVAMIVIGGVALVGYYATWVAWEAILVEDMPGHMPVAARVVRPDAVVRLAVQLNEVGTWGERRSYETSSTPVQTTKGTFLTLIWIAEALTLIGLPLGVGRSMLKNKPFCDTCDAWCTGPRTVRVTDPVDPKLLRERLEAGDFAYVAGLPAPVDEGQTMEFTVYACDTCKQLNTLSVVKRTVKRDRKGTVRSNQAKTIVDKLRVTTDDLAKLAGAPPVPQPA